MPDDLPPAPGGAAPPAPPAPEPPKPPPPAPPPPGGAAPVSVTLSSDQLKARLDETREAERRTFLKDLGFEKPEDVKAALGKLKVLETANLTETEKLQASIKELTPQVEAGKAAQELLKLVVDEQFAKLPEAVRKVIDETAEGDAEQRYVLMRVLAAAGGGAPPEPPKPAPPGNLGPAPAPPPSGSPTAFEKWEQMKARHPMLGDTFYKMNQIEIERTRPSAT